ncbi:uncharacterized protein LOC144074884 isoform X2 [Stigmatopora argus]
MLKDMVRQRLIAAADEIFALFERTIASYEEQLCGAREESERQRRLLEEVYDTQNAIHIQEAPEFREKEEAPELREKEEAPELSEKEEAPELSVFKEEKEETDINEFNLMGDNEDVQASQCSRFNCQSPGEDPRVESPADNLLAPLSDSSDTEELLRSHEHAEGNLGDCDWDLTFETEDDDSGSLLEKSTSPTCHAEHIMCKETQGSPSADKKRISRQPEWLRSKMKEARNKGKAYVNTRGIAVPKKNLVALPHHLCRLKCIEQVSEEERRSIFHNFWDLGDFDLQNTFICTSVKLVNIQRRRRQRQQQDVGEPKNRAYSRKYSLTTARSGYVEVCKTFFLATLCVSNGRVDRALQKQIERGEGLPSPDGRGKHYNRKRVSNESLQAIKDHINLFPSYSTQQNMTCLSPNLTVAQMHRLYKEQCRKSGREPEKVWVYRRMFLARFSQSFHSHGNITSRLSPLISPTLKTKLIL